MTDKKLIGRYKTYIKEKLSKKRYTHSINVANAALELARRYGADEDKAYIAGLLHDCAKEMPAEEQLALAKHSQLDVCEIELEAVPLYHAIAGAEIVRAALDVRDPEIILAIRYHTVGCANMSKLAAIVYLADLISEDRDYKDVKKMRKFAAQSLEKALFEAFRFSIKDSAEKGNLIPASTFEAYNEYAAAVKKSAEKERSGG